MNTPTPRTDAEWSASFDEYSQQLETDLTALTAERDQLRAELADEKNLHAQTRTVVEELNTICTDLRNAGGLPFIRSEAIRLLREDQAALRAELATERARMDDLVADLNDACITLASAKDDCDDYALLNTGFKLTAVRDVLLQYIPNAAMKEGAK